MNAHRRALVLAGLAWSLALLGHGAAAQAADPAGSDSNAAAAAALGAAVGRPDDPSWQTPEGARAAVRIARSSERLKNLVALRRGKLQVSAKPTQRGTWGVVWSRGDTPVILVEVTPDADRVIQVRGAGLTVMPGSNEFRGSVLWGPWLWAVSLACFVLALLPRGRPPVRTLLEVGVLAALAAAAYVFIRFTDSVANWVQFARGEYVVAYALLAGCAGLLAARMVTRTASTPSRPLLGTRILWLLAAAGVCARLAMLAWSPVPHDVGIAGATGAELMLGSAPVYGNMPTIPGHLVHGDTYGPLNYVAYVPAHGLVWLFDRDVPYESVAAVTSAWTDLLCLLLVIVLARRMLAPGWDAAAAAAWVAWPVSTLCLLTETNDALLAAGLLATLVVLHSPVRRGMVLAAAAAVKFAPILAAGVMLRANGERLRDSWWRVAAGAAVVAALCVAYLARYDDGFHQFLDATIRYQARRDDIESLWGLFGLDGVRSTLQYAVAALAAALLVLPRTRSPRTMAAALALTMVGLQLALRQWRHEYALWVFAPALLAFLPPRDAHTTGEDTAGPR